jgi:hypothetical protein
MTVYSRMTNRSQIIFVKRKVTTLLIRVQTNTNHFDDQIHWPLIVLFIDAMSRGIRIDIHECNCIHMGGDIADCSQTIHTTFFMAAFYITTGLNFLIYPNSVFADNVDLSFCHLPLKRKN